MSGSYTSFKNYHSGCRVKAIFNFSANLKELFDISWISLKIKSIGQYIRIFYYSREDNKNEIAFVRAEKCCNIFVNKHD